MKGDEHTGIRLQFVALDDRVVDSLTTALDRVVDVVEIVRSSSVNDGCGAVDCLVVGSARDRPFDHLDGVTTDTADPPVVVVHEGDLDHDTIERATAAGVADVVSRADLSTRGDLFVRRVVTLARAHQVRRDGDQQSTRPEERLAPTHRTDRPVDRSGGETAEQLQRDRAFLYAFHDITMDAEASFDEQASALLELCCDTLEFESGVLSRVSENDYEIRAVHAPGEHIAVGDEFDLDDTYCKQVVDTASVDWFLDVDDTESERAYQTFGQESFLGIPVHVGDDLYGTLCLTSEGVRERSIDDADVALARLVSEWVGSDLLRARRQRELQALTDRLESLIDVTPLAVIALDSDRTVTRWNAGAETMFGWSAEEILGEQYPLVPDGKDTEAKGLLHRSLTGEGYRGIDIRRQTKTEELLDLRLSTAPIPNADGGVNEVYAIMDDVTSLRRFERKLRSLQTTTSELNLAAAADDIVQLTVDAVTDVLGHPLTAFWEYDPEENALVPTAHSEAIEGQFSALPRFEPSDVELWAVFEQGECMLYDDPSAIDDRYEGIRSGIGVPLGDHGVLAAGTTTANEYDEQDLELVRILAAAAEAALTRADRERRLRETNEQLDEFASVVAHDLRNPLTAAMGYLDIARETGASDHFDRIEGAHDRMADFIDDLLTLARNTDGPLDSRTVSLESVVEEAWSYVDTSDETLQTGELGTIECDPDHLGRLAENLFRNAFEHGQATTVRVERLDDGGFAIEDDGSGFDGVTTDDLFERGVTSNDEGTGYGLSIVADIATAHGWTVEALAADAGGARFEVHPQ